MTRYVPEISLGKNGDLLLEATRFAPSEMEALGRAARMIEHCRGEVIASNGEHPRPLAAIVVPMLEMRTWALAPSADERLKERAAEEGLPLALKRRVRDGRAVSLNATYVETYELLHVQRTSKPMSYVAAKEAAVRLQETLYALSHPLGKQDQS